MTGNAPHCTCPAVWMSVLPPPPCPAHSWHFTPSVTIPVTTTQQFTPIAPSISDADIERIAKRVAEMNAPKPDLHATTDASVWAREFCRMHGGDEGLMIGWFANAIMAGHDAAERKARE